MQQSAWPHYTTMWLCVGTAQPFNWNTLAHKVSWTTMSATCNHWIFSSYSLKVGKSPCSHQHQDMTVCVLNIPYDEDVVWYFIYLVVKVVKGSSVGSHVKIRRKKWSNLPLFKLCQIIHELKCGFASQQSVTCHSKNCSNYSVLF